MYILQLGNDQLTEKATYYSKSFEKLGLKTVYLSEDRSGLSASFIEDLKLDAYILPKSILSRLYLTFKIFLKYKPRYVELYLSQRPWFLMSYYILARFFGAKIYVWCRGELRNYRKHHYIRRITNNFLLKNVDYVFLRELYMEKVLSSNNIIPKKMEFIHNGVPVGSQSKYFPTSKNILFMNSFKDFRNVDLLIKSFKKCLEVCPELKLLLVGSTLNNETYSPSSEAYELYLRGLVEKLNLTKNVDFIDFTSDRLKYFSDCFIYVLPADIVFLNYSLLEAMNNGVPSLIIETEGADYIIDDGVDGFISQKDELALAEKIIHFYQMDTSKKMLISENCIIKVNSKFSIDSQFDKMSKFIK